MKPAALVLLALLAAVALVRAPGFAQVGGLACFAPATPAAKIAACTQTLTDATLPPVTRALALLARADAYVANGERARALADYDAALGLTPDAAGFFARGKLHDAAGEALKAEADYTAALTHGPALAEAYVARARLRSLRGADADALKDLSEARRIAPDNAEAQALFAAAQLKAGQSGAAAAAFSAALSASPADQGTALRGRATAAARAGDFAAAVADFSAALKLNPNDMAALEGRGMALLQSSAYSAAVADFSALMGLRPADPAPLFFRASAKLQAGDVTAATDYTAFLKARPGDIEALMGRALSFQFAGDLSAADADFSAILRAQPGAAPPLAARGLLRLMRGNLPAAAADLGQAMALPDAPAHLPLWRFVALARAGDATAQATLAGSAPQGAWPAPVGDYFLGRISGDDLLKAAAREPASAPGRLCEAYFYLGEAALLANDKAEAAKLFKAALGTGMTRYSEYAAAKAELARLESGR